jgi:hypothetical protein
MREICGLVTQADINAANSDFTASIRTESIVGVFKTDSAEEEKAIVCDRTKTWLRKIIGDQEEDVKFYALGFAHLFPSAFGNRQCKGLLNDLRDKGFSVSLAP